jgi:hypothetical protein
VHPLANTFASTHHESIVPLIGSIGGAIIGTG